MTHSLIASIPSPTRLVTPEEFAPSMEPLVSQSTLIWVFAVGALGLIGLMVLSRRRKLEPQEHAFRALSRRMKLSKGQVRSLRKRSRSLGVSPVALLVCPKSARVMEDASRRFVGSGVVARIGNDSQRPRLIAS